MEVKTIKTIRKQLKIAHDFAASTPAKYPLYWTGDFPAYIDEYNPAEWDMENKPLWQVWDEYLAELKSQNLLDYYSKARELPIADLLAATNTTFC